MSTPNVVVTIDDFVTGVPTANQSGYLCKLSDEKKGYTNSSGVATIESVTPGEYLLQIFGLGVEDRTVTVPDEAGPLNAIDLTEGNEVSSGDVSPANPLIAGDNITLTQTAAGLQIEAEGGQGSDGFTDTDGALSIESDVAPNGEAFTLIAPANIDAGYLLNLLVGETYVFVFDAGGGLISYGDEAKISLNDSEQNETMVLNPGASGAPYYFDTTANHTEGNLVEIKNATVSKASIDFAGKLTLTSSIETSAPTGGTAGAWKLGIKVDASTTLDTAKYLQVDIGGTLYKVALVTS
jgi:hypothetical protein